jgi:hypothetical protein
MKPISILNQASGETLADRGDKAIGCAVTGSANRYTIILACTMSGEKPPPLHQFQGQGQKSKPYVERVFHHR